MTTNPSIKRRDTVTATHSRNAVAPSQEDYAKFVKDILRTDSKEYVEYKNFVQGSETACSRCLKAGTACGIFNITRCQTCAIGRKTCSLKANFIVQYTAPKFQLTEKIAYQIYEQWGRSLKPAGRLSNNTAGAVFATGQSAEVGAAEPTSTFTRPGRKRTHKPVQCEDSSDILSASKRTKTTGGGNGNGEPNQEAMIPVWTSMTTEGQGLPSSSLLPNGSIPSSSVAGWDDDREEIDELIDSSPVRPKPINTSCLSGESLEDRYASLEELYNRLSDNHHHALDDLKQVREEKAKLEAAYQTLEIQQKGIMNKMIFHRDDATLTKFKIGQIAKQRNRLQLELEEAIEAHEHDRKEWWRKRGQEGSDSTDS